MAAGCEVAIAVECGEVTALFWDGIFLILADVGVRRDGEDFDDTARVNAR